MVCPRRQPEPEPEDWELTEDELRRIEENDAQVEEWANQGRCTGCGDPNPHNNGLCKDCELDGFI